MEDNNLTLNSNTVQHIKQTIEIFTHEPEYASVELVRKLLLEFLAEKKTSTDIHEVQKQKREKRGGFEQRLILETVTTLEGTEQTYNKLVRDKILEELKTKGLTYTSHIADDYEFKRALEVKIQEELTEFFDDPSLEEAADLLEVMQALLLFSQNT